MKHPVDITRQDDLPLASLRAHAIFPGRNVLKVAEVATALRCDERHVVALLEEWEDTGGRSGLKGFSIASGLKAHGVTRGNKTPRACWRIALSDFDAFVKTKAASHQA